MLIIAHRGMGEPRNTITAFERAVEHGFGVEFDVWLTGDGRLVVLYDQEFTSGGKTYRVKDVSLLELRALSPHRRADPHRGGDARRVREQGCTLNADVKDPVAVPLDGVNRMSMPIFKLLVRWARLIGLKIGFWSYEADELSTSRG